MIKACKYCGKETTGMTYCNKTCKEMNNALSMKQLMENIDMLSGHDKKWLVNVPLYFYNKFFSRKVEKETYVTMLENISARMIPIELKFAVAYYNAARASKETFMEIGELRTALASKHDFDQIKSHVSYKFSRRISGREMYDAQFDVVVNRVKKSLDFGDDFVKKLSEMRKSTSIDDFVKMTTKYANAAVFVLLMLMKVQIRQEYFSKISNTSPVTIRRITRMLMRSLKQGKKVNAEEKLAMTLRNFETTTLPLVTKRL